MPAADAEAIRQLARTEARIAVARELPKFVAAINKTTKTPLGTVAGTSLESRLDQGTSGGTK